FVQGGIGLLVGLVAGSLLAFGIALFYLLLFDGTNSVSGRFGMALASIIAVIVVACQAGFAWEGFSAKGLNFLLLTVAVAGAVAVAVAGAGAGAVAGAFAVAGAVVGTLATLAVAYAVSRRALRGDPRDPWLRSLAVAVVAWGGTCFTGADLTDADCSGASLKGAHLYGATLTRTRLHRARQVNLARLGKTILADVAVQDLLISLRGRGRAYRGKNLQGANLATADLVGADFTEADLSQATLAGADLQQANLTKTQALGTEFRQADLTGACLEAWNIDSTTQLAGARCDYVYLLSHHQERRPHSGHFQPGEFTKLFEEVLDTIDLIFQNGIDWKVFLQTFQQVQVQQGEAELAIQSIENKGDGVMVVKLKAAPDTDKAGVHQLFMSGYHTALEAAEQRYKAQLQAKDDEIQRYHQQNANMQEVVKLLAAKPITIDVRATAESKAMQGNDHSQNLNIQGDFNLQANNSVVSLGDISGQVSNQIHQLPLDSTPGQPSLRELLSQLQQAIETDPELQDSTRVEALTEVQELATAAQHPEPGVMQKAARAAMNGLKGIAASLSDVSKLAVACKDLLPLIMTALGLP
ncbi:MAG: pentapeptide repeat-containing protein, partial [Nodosilinea sp.]